MNWINDLKIGDEVLTIERIHNKIYKWKSIVLSVTSSYIETSYNRDINNEDLIKLCKNLAVTHRTYTKIFVKNYIGTNGSINIEKYTAL